LLGGDTPRRAAPKEPVVPEPRTEAPPTVEPPPAESAPAEAPAARGEPSSATSSAPAPASEPAPEAEAAPTPMPLAEPESDQDVGSWWAALVERLPLDGAARNLARNTVLAARQENQWTLRLSTGHQVLVNPERTQELAGALSDYFQRRIRLNLEYDAEAGDTPEALDQERRRVRLEEARGALLEDQTVQTLIQQFNARLDESSIQPRDHDQSTD
jgi:DNA polymerase-3 subunit gamma/tau